jgi:hypothetical protein
MARAAGFDMPFLVREAGSHSGKQLVLLEGADLEALDGFAFDGREYYVTEFVDFRSPDGLYRKYRVIVIGGVPHARHLVIARTWSINASDRHELMEQREFDQEEEQFLREFRPEDHPVFGAISSILGLDYFGVDFAYDLAGDLVVFEANACFRVLWEGEPQSSIPSHVASDGEIRASLVDLLRQRGGLVERS